MAVSSDIASTTLKVVLEVALRSILTLSRCDSTKFRKYCFNCSIAKGWDQGKHHSASGCCSNSERHNNRKY